MQIRNPSKCFFQLVGLLIFQAMIDVSGQSGTSKRHGGIPGAPLCGILPSLRPDLRGVCLAPLFQPMPASVPASPPHRFRSLRILQDNFAFILLSLAVVISIAGSISPARAAIDRSKPYGLYANASAWLEKNTPSSSRVFQTDWDDFPRLFFYNTHNTYLIGLDPTYLQLIMQASTIFGWILTRAK